jgi:mono/diheme cytochrome c family protein
MLHCGIHGLHFASGPLLFSASSSPDFRCAPEEDPMKVVRLLALSVAMFAIAGFSTIASADAAAGKAKFAAACAECHEVADFEGESAAALTETMKKIVAGTQKHKQALKLTDAEIADLAACITAGK